MPGIRGNELNQNWSLDAVGNWSSNTLNGTAQTRAHNPANQISSINSSTSDVGYDLAGNMTTMPRLVGNDANGHQIGVYDAWNRLVKLQSDESTPTVYSTMVYDGRGRRISKAITNSNNWNCTYHYYLAGDSIVEVRNGSDMVLKQQVWGITYIDELVQEGINSSPTTQSTCNTFYWACQDANYNVTLLVDNQGNKVERYAYTPYGVRTAYKAANLGDAQLTLAIGSSQAVQVGGVNQPYGLCEFGYQGLAHDEESGLIYVRNRYLQPGLGRWMTPEPFRGDYVDGMNLYEYLGSSPEDRGDPDGLKCVWATHDGDGAESGIWWTGDGPHYGNWTGGDWSGGQHPSRHGNVMGSDPPVDSLDACAKDHDYCWDACDRAVAQMHFTQGYHHKSIAQQKQEAIAACQAPCNTTLHNCAKNLGSDASKWPSPPPCGCQSTGERMRHEIMAYF